MTTDSVLLIDNDPVFTRVVSQTLQAGGYDVDAVSTAVAAETLLAQGDYGAVVLSIDVRDRDPEVFLRALAADDRQPIVMLVGTHLDLQEMVRFYDTGCVFNHRRKPLDDLGDLIRDIGRAMEHRLVKRQNGYLLTQLRDARDELRQLSEFMVQVEKAATFGWVANGLVGDMEAALAGAPTLSDAPGAGRSMRAHSLTELQETLDHCRALVSDARSAMSGPRNEHRPIELSSLVSSVLRLHRSMLDARGIEVELGPVDESVVVNGDGPNLRLVVTSLLQNACQAMAGGGKVTISLLRHGSNVHLCVKDDGPGMPTEILSRAFDAFYTTRAMGEGTGLGLTVAKEIVHQHAGEIILASIEGQGTTAVVTIPVFQVEEIEPVTEQLLAAA